MADASSVRVSDSPTSLPSPTGRAASGIRFYQKELNLCTGTQWSPLGRVRIVVPIQAAAEGIDQNVFIADQAYQLISVAEVHSVAGGAGATAAIMKCTGTQAASAGVNMLTAAFDLTTTANTNVSGTLSATAANTALAVGDRINIDFSGTITPLAGSVVVVTLRAV
jgi:hypothetical protein